MRIAMVTTPRGGAFGHSVTLCRALLEAGHHTLLFGADEPFLDIPFSRTAIGIGRSFNFVLNRRKLHHDLAAFRPDLLHVHAPSGNADLMARELSLRFQVPLVFSYHVVPFENRTPMDLVVHTHFRLTERVLAHADAVICATHLVQQRMQRSKAIDPEAVHIVPYGIDTQVFRQCARKRSGAALRILFVGRVQPEKGIGLLLKAVSLLSRDHDLTIIGSSPWIKYYGLRYRHVSNVSWTGWIESRDELAAAYSSSDITVFPSLWEEAFGLVVAESMACMTPVLTFDYASSTELISHETDGFILESRTPTGIARFLEHADRTKLHQMGKLARETICRRFAIKPMLESTLRVYSQVLR